MRYLEQSSSETEKAEVTRGLGVEEWAIVAQLQLMGTELQYGVTESSRNSPDGHNNMNRLHATEPYHLKMVKTVNFVIYFTTIHF